MNILSGIIIFALVVLSVAVIMIGVIMVSTGIEIAEAIKGISLDKDADGKVKFIGPTTTQFGRAPAPRKSNMPKSRDKAFIGPKNHKNWGIH